MARMLALTWYGADDKVLEEALIVSSLCGLGSKTVQNAGRSFWESYEKPLMSETGSDGAGETKSGDASPENDHEKAFREKKEKRQKESKGKDGGLLKISEGLKGKDLCEVLEIEPGASAEDVKKSYRKLVLTHHPDKMTDPTEEQKAHFLIIQEAYEIFSDPEKRKRYESSLDFDESIPSNFGRGKLANADFFEVFQPVFKRNARWSARPRVPDLGDESTNIETVKAFYEFWHTFESWRDPIAMAEKEEYELHCLEEAECREERRWMERENARVARKIAQAERERVADLVKLAERNDPRMIAHKEQVKQQKEEEKAKKAAALQAEKDRKAAELRAKEEQEEAKRKQEAEARAAEKKIKDEQKNALKAARQRLRALHKAAEAPVRRAVHVDQLQDVCLRLDTEALHAICDEIEAAFAKKSDDAAVELMHREILASGATPITDESVTTEEQGSGDSTGSPGESDGEEGTEEDEVQEEAYEPTPEELEMERLRLEAQAKAEAEAERIRQEKKAEELRKKREQQKKEDERRQAEQRKAEKKEREKAAKVKAQAEKKAEEEAKAAEALRAKQEAQREAQREAAQKEEAERRRLHEDGLIARAFEADRLKRSAILEAYEEGLLESAMRSTLLREGSDAPATKLRLALRQIAAEMPAAPVGKEVVSQADREREEICMDAALAALATQGADGAGPEEARGRLAGALSVAIRPPRDAVELSKDAKAAVKKQRTRVRMVMLSVLRDFAKNEPMSAAAKPKAVGDKAPAAASVTAGTVLIAAEEGAVFASADSYDEIGEVVIGMTVTAAGKCVEVDGYDMVPIKPKGTVELRILRATEAAAPKPKAKAKAAPKTEEVDGQLLDFVRISGADAALFAADAAIRQAYDGSFDAAAVVAAVQVPEAAPAQEQEAAPAAKGKKGKKAAEKPEEEDLDALLNEFGMTPVAGGKKKKGSKK